MHAETLFQRAKTALEQANMALKAEKYDQALQLAAQAETSARDAFAIAEVADKQRLEKEAREEKMAQAKDAIFKAEEAINREAGTQVPILTPGLYRQAKATLADAQKALADENYQRAITSGKQSLALMTQAIEKAPKIEAADTRILNAAKAIPDAETAQTEKGITIRFSGNLFGQKAMEISPKYVPMLGQLAEIIKEFADYKVRLEGHSDSVGDADANLTLTEKRAKAFMKYLSEKCGVPAERMTAVGLGESQPITDNVNQAGRDKNRRIDTIILTRE
jgi:outer membrane protein OmpA-like peptidoglycan-associated protein